MKTFIDESGIFRDPKGNPNSVSCVGALTMPDSAYQRASEDFAKLGSRFGISGEIKGSKLNEVQINEIVMMLEKYDPVFTVIMVDVAVENEVDTQDHLNGQIVKMTANITEAHHPDLVAQVHRLQDILRNMSAQLYLQTVCMTQAIHHAYRDATMYYAQRLPEELGAFQWRVDRKDKQMTAAEEWWAGVIRPILQTRGIREPHPIFEGGNYSFFDSQFQEVLDEPPEWFQPHMDIVERPFHFIRLDKVFRDFEFIDSRDDPGLQMVDVVTTATRRAMSGTLGRAGWNRIGRLMIRRVDQSIHLITLSNTPKSIHHPYARTVQHFNDVAKPMLVRRTSNGMG